MMFLLVTASDQADCTNQETYENTMVIITEIHQDNYRSIKYLMDQIANESISYESAHKRIIELYCKSDLLIDRLIKLVPPENLSRAHKELLSDIASSQTLFVIVGVALEYQAEGNAFMTKKMLDTAEVLYIIKNPVKTTPTKGVVLTVNKFALSGD